MYSDEYCVDIDTCRDGNATVFVEVSVGVNFVFFPSGKPSRTSL